MSRPPMHLLCRLIGFSAVIVGMSACGGDSHPLAPVSGKVTLDGQPLANAKIGFEPIRKGDELEAGPGSYAKTNSAGHFELVALDGTPGAVIGKHRVWIRTMEAREDSSGNFVVEREEILPPRYHDETELTFVVPDEGTAEAEFPLTVEQ